MNSTVTSVAESWLTGVPSSPSSSGDAVVVRAEFGTARPLPLPSTLSLDAVVAGFESEPDQAEALKDARVELAERLYEDRPLGLARLRLRAGLSQSQLASLAGTSQAHIARIEAGKNDPGTSVVARIASVLGVAEADAFIAIRADQLLRR